MTGSIWAWRPANHFSTPPQRQPFLIPPALENPLNIPQVPRLAPGQITEVQDATSLVGVPYNQLNFGGSTGMELLTENIRTTTNLTDPNVSKAFIQDQWQSIVPERDLAFSSQELHDFLSYAWLNGNPSPGQTWGDLPTTIAF